MKSAGELFCIKSKLFYVYLYLTFPEKFCGVGGRDETNSNKYQIGRPNQGSAFRRDIICKSILGTCLVVPEMAHPRDKLKGKSAKNRWLCISNRVGGDNPISNILIHHSDNEIAINI